MTIHRFLDLAEISYLAQDSVQISDQVGQYRVMGCDKEETEPEQCLYHVSYRECYIKLAPLVGGLLLISFLNLNLNHF
jgi:hypothetical protein